MRGLVKRIRGLNGDQRGLTAIELAVVVAILAVLAAIVAGNTTGMSANARGASKGTDIAEIQKAVDRYKGENPTAGYPVTGDYGTLTQTTDILFTAAYTTPEGTSKTFVPNFLQRNPKHASDATISWKLSSSGIVTNTLADSAY